MYAVVRTGGKQYRVEQGSQLNIETLPGDVGEQIELSEVLLVGEGEKIQIGQPLVQGAKVKAKIVSQLRAPKVIIYKKIRRHGKELKKGHRQNMTRICVEEIVL